MLATPEPPPPPQSDRGSSGRRRSSGSGNRPVGLPGIKLERRIGEGVRVRVDTEDGVCSGTVRTVSADGHFKVRATTTQRAITIHGHNYIGPGAVRR